MSKLDRPSAGPLAKLTMVLALVTSTLGCETPKETMRKIEAASPTDNLEENITEPDKELVYEITKEISNILNLFEKGGLTQPEAVEAILPMIEEIGTIAQGKDIGSTESNQARIFDAGLNIVLEIDELRENVINLMSSGETAINGTIDKSEGSSN